MSFSRATARRHAIAAGRIPGGSEGGRYHQLMQAFCLSIHAGYACRHSGACCTAGWPIPIERGHEARLRDRGLIGDSGSPRTASTAGGGRPRMLMLRTDDRGACEFYDERGGRLCAIHRDAGPALLPTACRNFPRVTLRDRRGIFVTLSHYCPTAARMLLDAGDIAIVEAPSSISLDDEVEGLDATSVMPPLLRAGMLTDLDGYAAWERQAVAVFDERGYSARRAVRTIRDATADACRWSPGAESLAARVERAFAHARPRRERRTADPRSDFEHPLKAFLAAQLFASWAAYHPHGLIAIVESVEQALQLAGERFDDERAFVEAVRGADLRLRHMQPRRASA
jgi:Fe-S-cluster containining protein